MAHRYFVDRLPDPGRGTLTGDLAHHLGRVLRARAGDRLVLSDGRGGTAAATVLAVTKQEVAVEVAPATHEAPATLQVTLAFGVVRGPRVDWLLEHGTEVGVANFQPLWTKHTRPQGERPERWQRIVTAAAGQCDRAWLPALHPALELEAFLQQPLPPCRLLASATGPAATNGPPHDGSLVLLVGPEGGFDDRELAAIAAAQFAPHRFGPHTLRTETAALVGAAILLAR